MIAAWMLYGMLVAALVGLAGLAVEYSLRALRRPVRFVWVGAMLVAILLPPVQLVLAGTTGPALLNAQPPASIAEPVVSQRGTPRSTDVPFQATRSFGVPGRLSALDIPLLAVWLGLSILWAAMLLISAKRLRRESARWKAVMVDGSPMYVSHDVGPALFGISRYSIVVPAWVLSLDDRRRQLLLDHEREHARTADPVVLMGGALLVMLQPWNPGLWLMFHRLRFALELDCDARVLARAPDIRAYGELLLEVGSRSLAGGAPMAAFSEPYSMLSRRIAMMTSRPVRRPTLQGLAALTVGGALTLAACYVPRPAIERPTIQPTRATAIHSDSAREEPKRVLVRVTSVGLRNVTGRPTVLFFTTGTALLGIAGATPTPLNDTLTLSSLPAFTADLTNGDLHLQLQGTGMLDISGAVEGGPMTRFSVAGRHIVLHRGGHGVSPFGIGTR